MKYLFYALLAATLLLTACKKEPKSYADLSIAERFEYLQIGCTPSDKQNYFTGTINGEDFCYYESDTDSMGTYLAQTIMTQSPIISTGAAAHYVEGGYFLEPSSPHEPGDFRMWMIYRDTGYTGAGDWATFMAKHFVPGRDLLFSRSDNQVVQDSVTSGKKVPGSYIQGFSADFWIRSEYPGYNLFRSCSITQPSTSYAKCTKFVEHKGGIEVEVEVDMLIPAGRDGYEVKPKRLKGRFHLNSNKPE